MVKLNGEKVQLRLDRSDDRFQNAMRTQQRFWCKLKTQLDENKSLVRSGNVVMDQIRQRVDWISTLSQDIKTRCKVSL